MEIKLNEKKLNKIKMLMRQSSKIGSQRNLKKKEAFIV